MSSTESARFKEWLESDVTSTKWGLQSSNIFNYCYRNQLFFTEWSLQLLRYGAYYRSQSTRDCILRNITQKISQRVRKRDNSATQFLPSHLNTMCSDTIQRLLSLVRMFQVMLILEETLEWLDIFVWDGCGGVLKSHSSISFTRGKYFIVWLSTIDLWNALIYDLVGVQIITFTVKFIV